MGALIAKPRRTCVYSRTPVTLAPGTAAATEADTRSFISASAGASSASWTMIVVV